MDEGESQHGLPKNSIVKFARTCSTVNSNKKLQMTAEVQSFLVSACTEFVSMVGTESAEECNRGGKSIIAPEHVLGALEKLGHGGHVDELRGLVEEEGAERKSKRERRNLLA